MIHGPETVDVLLTDVPPTSSSVIQLTKTVGDRLELVCNVTTRPPPYLHWTFQPSVCSSRSSRNSNSSSNSSRCSRSRSRLVVGSNMSERGPKLVVRCTKCMGTHCNPGKSEFEVRILLDSSSHDERRFCICISFA